MSDKTQLILKEVYDVKGIVHMNIVNINQNMTDLEVLELKTERLKQSSEVWRKQTFRMKLNYLWTNYKSNILSGILIIFTTMVIIVLMIISNN